MNLSAVITQIRALVPSLGTRVGGAADYRVGIETTVDVTALPAAFVIPLDDNAKDNELQNGLLQQVTEKIGVIVEFDSTADRRGQTSVSQVEQMKYDLFKALLNWRLDNTRAQRGLSYAGGRILDFDRARLFWQFDFEQVVTIDDDDGFQITGVPLTEVDMYDTNHPPLHAAVTLPE